MHITMEAFDYPSSLLASSDHWAILLRPKQITIGSLVLVIRDRNVKSVGAIPPGAGQEFPNIIAVIEKTLGAEFGAAKFNYLCLMMVDPHVHFHVVPRYPKPVAFEGCTYIDDNWPGPPEIKATLAMEHTAHQRLHEALKAAFINNMPETLIRRT